MQIISSLYNSAWSNVETITQSNRSITSTEATRQRVAGDVEAFMLKQESVIKCYDQYNQLIGFKTRDHMGEIDVISDRRYELVEEFKCYGVLVCSILFNSDGYMVKDNRTGKMSRAFDFFDKANTIAEKKLSLYKSYMNRKGDTKS